MLDPNDSVLLPGSDAIVTPSRRRFFGLGLATVLGATALAACDPEPILMATSGPELRLGSTGSEVQTLQNRLGQLHFFLWDTPGRFGNSTYHAVVAFQKVFGLSRDGRVGNATRAKLNQAFIPIPSSTSGRVIEVHLNPQVVILAVDGATESVLDTSTGKSSTPTPRGRFKIFRRIDGIREAPLGTLYRPMYFNGGVALHGSPSVPPYPASHGCVRLTNQEADHLWSSGWGIIGRRVWVV